MKFYKKPIFTGFAPNLTGEAVKIACAFLFLPWRWPKLRIGGAIKKVEQWLKNYFQVQEAICFDSGRSALYFALKALEVGEGDEVLLQSYTCVVVINAIRWIGAKPIFVDINNDFNMSADDLENKYSPKAKALIIQHTFGRPCDLDKFLAFAKKHNLKIIEDCAHSLGARCQNKLTGAFGDIGMLSFGSDKIISCVRGGALITNDKNLAKKILQCQNTLPLSTLLKTIQHLLHYPFFYFCKPFYNLEIGKWELAVAKKMNIYNKIIYPSEKMGLPVAFYPARLPNSLAKILLKQFSTLAEVIAHQKEIAKYYHNNLNNPMVTKPQWSDDSVWLRYTILVKNAPQLHQFAKKEGIIFGNWYDAPVAPKDVDLNVISYVAGACPNDERLSQMSVNLPTDRHISLIDAKRVVKIVNQYGD